MFETGVVGKRARSREEDKAIESNRMREGNERAMESEKDATVKERENCTARYCLDVGTALLTFHLPVISFFLAAYFLLLCHTALLSL